MVRKIPRVYSPKLRAEIGKLACRESATKAAIRLGLIAIVMDQTRLVNYP